MDDPSREERTMKRRLIPEPKPLRVPPPDYEPSKAELEEEFDMPGLSLVQVR